MRVLIVAGSRTVDDAELIRKAIESLKPDEVVCGMAKGADTIGHQIADEMGIPVKEMPAEWSNIDAPGAVIKRGPYGPYNARAGHDRNARMADYADMAVVIFRGKTSGSMDMVELMIDRRKPVLIAHQLEDQDDPS